MQKEKKKRGQKADICPPEIELEPDIEIEQEIDIELEEEKEKENSCATGAEISQNVESVFSYYETNITKLTDEQRKELQKYSEKMQSEHEKQKQNKNNRSNKLVPFKTYEQRNYKDGELNSLYMNRK